MRRSAAALVVALASMLAASAVVAGPATAQERPTPLQAQILEAERAFAKTMEARDVQAFARYVSEEAVFYGKSILRGREQVVEGWRTYFQGARAPFSWDPEHVEVLRSGTLALSSGPVYDPHGKRIGTFNSVWRLEADGRWRVIFDKGCSCTP